MLVFSFLLGLLCGLGFWYGRQQHVARKLDRILQTLPARDNGDISLPTTTRLRREIARLQQRDRQLSADLATWQQLVDVAPIGYLQVDEENQLLWCNRQARHLLHVDRWQTGQVRLLLEVVRSYELDRLIEETRRTQVSQVREWVYHATDMSSERLAGRRSTPIARATALKASGFPLPEGHVGVFLENLQPLVELSQARDRVFSDLTHELRTPLTSIRLVAEALQSRLHPPESRWVEQMLGESNRLIHLVEDWLEIAQLQKTPGESLNLQTVNLGELVVSVWETLAPLAAPKQLHLDCCCEPEPIYLQADRSRLMQVFLNLFDNAIKYSPVGGTVWVKAALACDPKTLASLVRIAIVDNGEGFSESDLKHVFDRLYRGHSSSQISRLPEISETLAARPGTGLGLSIVQQIVLAHNGSIEAKNHPETGGAWLEIALPQGKANVP